MLEWFTVRVGRVNVDEMGCVREMGFREYGNFSKTIRMDLFFLLKLEI